MTTVLWWLRRDLRLADNPALDAALGSGHRVVPVYIHAPEEEAPWAPGAASLWWLHHSLHALIKDLRALGGGLIIRKGDSFGELQRLVAETGAEAVYWNRLYEPALIERDRKVKMQLQAAGIGAESRNAALLREPWEIKTGVGEPYRVFSPFWRNLASELETLAPATPAPPTLPALPEGLPSLDLDALALRPRVAWDGGMRQSWQPGEASATALLATFIDDAMAEYGDQRNRPDRPGTSRLSPHLHFGEISPRQVLETLRAAAADGGMFSGKGAEPYLRELGWREFNHHLLYHFPSSSDQPLNPRFQNFPWAAPEPERLRAWQRGETGVPMVDAGMRELWHTGWMHNRVRMIVASFLTKNLRYPWQEGAHWFWDTLVDADLANNSQGWQWTAGTGADAAPYFRVFNPVSQGRKFDPDGVYVRRWLPELSHLPTEQIHAPWESDLKVPGYPEPLLDLKRSREAALEAFQQMKQG